MVLDQLNIDSYSGILKDNGSNLREYTVPGLVKTLFIKKKKKHACFLGFIVLFWVVIGLFFIKF